MSKKLTATARTKAIKIKKNIPFGYPVNEDNIKEYDNKKKYITNRNSDYTKAEFIALVKKKKLYGEFLRMMMDQGDKGDAASEYVDMKGKPKTAKILALMWKHYSGGLAIDIHSKRFNTEATYQSVAHDLFYYNKRGKDGKTQDERDDEESDEEEEVKTVKKRKRSTSKSSSRGRSRSKSPKVSKATKTQQKRKALKSPKSTKKSPSKSTPFPKKIRNSPNRKGPAESATEFEIGDERVGNDGNIWRIIKTKTTQRWSKIK